MARINWNEPLFGEEEVESVSEVIRAAYVNEGPKTKEFEELLKEYLGVKYIIFTTNATAALYLSIKAEAKLRDASKFDVIIPGMTMIASATSIGWAGGRPNLVDIESDRLTINADKIEEKITPDTIAIMPVHTIGRACDMNKIIKIAKKHGLAVIEDAAGALGSKLNGKYLGTFGKVGCFSLQANKIISSGQGGIIATNDEKLYIKIRRLRDFGRFSNKELYHEEEGYNLKFNDLSAALGLEQFKKIDKRKELLLSQRKKYLEELKNQKEIIFPRYTSEEIPLWIDVYSKGRDELIKYLNSFEIYPRPCWPAIHQNPPYKYLGTDEDLPNSVRAAKDIIWLPNGPAITDENIEFVCSKIKEFYLK
ncbi:MAG: DegT/DnrJ/EryC1/StrS family aminotransferase [Nanoarchaeota archaeon]|nr:DegT/DnrJ/EryC1/StrS family aminotransferase [Nanoarchaeota archaeon]